MTDQSGTPSRRAIASELDVVLGDVEDVSAANTAFLVGLSGRHAGKLFRIMDGESIIGRTSKALVTLDEKAVSHQHAKLTLNGRGCFVSDLGSTNGSFLNDERLTEPRELRAGDVLRFGHSTLGFLTDAADDEQHTRALARVTGTHTALGFNPAAVGMTVPEYSGPTMPPGPVSQAPQAITVNPPSTMAMPEEPEGNALDNALDKLALVFKYVKLYWKLIVFCGVLLATVAAATVAFKPPTALATFEIYLRHDRTKNPTQHFASRGVDFFVSAHKNFRNLELVKKTMSEMGMGTGEGAVRGTANGLSFDAKGHGSYRGSYNHVDGDFAERFLAAHLKNYLEREIGKSISVLAREAELLRKQFHENEKELADAEQELKTFKLEHLDALPAQAAAQLGSRIAMIEKRNTLMADLSRYEQELALAQVQLSSEDVFVESAVQRSAPYESELALVRKKIAAARAQGFTDAHPSIVAAKKEERELLDLRKREMDRGTTDTDRRSNPEHKRLANKVGQLKVLASTTSKELGLVNGRLGEIADVADKMPGVEAEFADLNRRVASSQSLHQRLFEQLKAKELQLEFERASVAARYEVVERPMAYPVNPVATSLKRAVIGGIGGMGGGVFLAAMHWLITYARRRRAEQAKAAEEASTQAIEKVA